MVRNKTHVETSTKSAPTGRLAWVGFACCVVSLACLLISFCSPYWLQSWPMSESRFMNIGLWQVCLYNYRQFKDDSQDVYDGCWSVFDDATRYFKLREWLTPPWFITCQVLSTGCLIIELASAIVAGLIFLHLCPAVNHVHLQTYGIYGSSSMMLLGTLISIVIAMVFGIKSNDRYWLPRPDQNFLSWGFAFLIISAIFALISAVFFFMEGRRVFKALFRNNKVYRESVTEAFAVPYDYDQAPYLPIYDKADQRKDVAVKVEGQKTELPESRSSEDMGAMNEGARTSGFGDLGQTSLNQIEDLSRTIEQCSSTFSE